MALSAGEILVNRREFAQAREVLEVAAQNCPNENPDKIRIAGDLALTYAAEGDMRTAYSMLASTSSLGVEQAEIHLRTFELAVATANPILRPMSSRTWHRCTVSPPMHGAALPMPFVKTIVSTIPAPAASGVRCSIRAPKIPRRPPPTSLTPLGD